MNMEGDYSMGNYEQLLTDTINGYMEVTENYRVMAAAFAANYAAGNDNAELAYRQMNYYYIEENGVKTYMGDYMLNFPTDDADFADILLKGNLFVLSNLRALLAMGTSVPGQTIAERVAEVGADSTVYDKVGHLADAKLVYEALANAQNQIDNTNKTIEEIEADTSLTRKEKNDSVDVLFKSIQNIVAFKSIIDAIPYGDRTYGEYLKQEITPEYSAFYPIVEALTPAQRALLGLGQFKEIVLYDSIRQTDENLEKELAAVESEFGEISVYLGTDLEAFNGSFAVTTEALRREAITGES
jgi:hypothetical protein